MNPSTTLFICHQCGLKDEHGKKIPNPKNEELAAAVQHELATRGLDKMQVQVVLSGCLSVCDPAPAWGLSSAGRYSYVFSPAPNAETLANFTKVYLDKPKGLPVYKADWPEGLAGTQISKLPPAPGSF
jgi:predicted metal-binding protein